MGFARKNRGAFGAAPDQADRNSATASASGESHRAESIFALCLLLIVLAGFFWFRHRVSDTKGEIAAIDAKIEVARIESEKSAALRAATDELRAELGAGGSGILGRPAHELLDALESSAGALLSFTVEPADPRKVRVEFEAATPDDSSVAAIVGALADPPFANPVLESVSRIPGGGIGVARAEVKEES